MKRDGSLGMEINYVSNLLRREVDRRINARHGEEVSRMNGWIIHYMLDHQDEDVFQKDLERVFAMSRSNVSKAVDQMVTKGLILRSPVSYDARLKKLSLTSRALELQRQIEKEIDGFEQGLMRNFSEQEISQFLDYLRRIAENVSHDAQQQRTERKRRDL